MDDKMKDILNMTIKRIEIVMDDTKLALENKTQNLIDAAISILANCDNMDSKEELRYWKQLYEYAEELYFETITNIPNRGEKDQYLASSIIMNEVLVCKKKIDKMIKLKDKKEKARTNNYADNLGRG